MGYSASVLGASGYAGGEVLRLLVAHPALDISAAAAARRSGEAAAAVHPNLLGRDLPELRDLAEVVATPVDVVFSCLPSGRLRPLLEDLRAEVVIDLSDDHRSDPDWTYGLTEFGRAGMPAPRVANPGCYPTGTLLALVPFVRAGAVEGPLVVDALSGVSGAGRRAEDRLLFSSATDNAGAYGTTEHRHIPEVERGLSVFGGTHLGVSFTPHLVPMARGLVVTARARITEALDDRAASDILHNAYQTEPFVEVIEGWPQTKAVIGTNRAHVSAHVDARNGWLVCSAAIDNLGKGAAGQALQNANVCLGLDEQAGLGAVGVWP